MPYHGQMTKTLVSLLVIVVTWLKTVPTMPTLVNSLAKQLGSIIPESVVLVLSVHTELPSSLTVFKHKTVDDRPCRFTGKCHII